MPLKKLSDWLRSIYECLHIMIKKLPYLLLVVFVVFLFLVPLFIKVKIECKSQFGDCPAEISSRLQKLNSKSLFSAERNARKDLKESFLISDFSIQFKLPNVMLVNVIAKKPYFALKNSSTGKFELIDQKGIVLTLTDNSGLPYAITPEPLKKVGESISTRDLFALNLILGVNEMYQVLYGTITNDALVVDIPPSVRVIFPLEGDSEILLGSLRLVYTKVTTSYLGIYSQIDMRYKNPVLR
jgi:hypothetical protein